MCLDMEFETLKFEIVRIEVMRTDRRTGMQHVHAHSGLT